MVGTTIEKIRGCSGQGVLLSAARLLSKEVNYGGQHAS
jgi:hypothetical protein